MYLGGNMPIRFWTIGRPLLSPSKGKDMNKDQLSTGYRLPQKNEAGRDKKHFEFVVVLFFFFFLSLKEAF